MKRPVVIALALLIPGIVAATPSLTVGAASGGAGSVVNVPINFTNGSSAVALEFDLAYDAAKATPGDAVKGSALNLTDHEVDSNLLSAGHFRVVILSLSSTVIPAGTVATVPFTLAANASGSISLTFENIEYVGAEANVIAGSSTNGTITVASACTPGDVFPAGTGGNGVGLADAVYGRRMAKGLVPTTAYDLQCNNIHPGSEICTASGKKHWCPDLGADADFDLGDFVVLRRIVLGTYIVTCSPCGARTATPTTRFVPGDIAPRGATDGQVNVADVVIALRLSVGLDRPTTEESAKADIAPALHQAGLTVAEGNGLVDVGDVVMLLRAAVGLENVAWPDRSAVVHLESTSPHIAFSAILSGWPAWVEPIGLDSSECTGDDAVLETADDVWGALCATDPGTRTGPSDLLTIHYRGPRVDPASLHADVEFVDAIMRDVPGQVSVTTP